MRLGLTGASMTTSKVGIASYEEMKARTSRTVAGNGLVRFERGERGRIVPKAIRDRVELGLPLTLSRKAR
jgi:hypothetical protein